MLEIYHKILELNHKILDLHHKMLEMYHVQYVTDQKMLELYTRC